MLPPLPAARAACPCTRASPVIEASSGPSGGPEAALALPALHRSTPRPPLPKCSARKDPLALRTQRDASDVPKPASSATQRIFPSNSTASRNLLCTILEMARALPRPQIGSESPNEFPIRELAGVQCSRYDSPRRRPHCPTFPFSIVASDAARLVQATRHRRRHQTMPLVPALPLRDAVRRAGPQTAHASAPALETRPRPSRKTVRIHRHAEVRTGSADSPRRASLLRPLDPRTGAGSRWTVP